MNLGYPGMTPGLSGVPTTMAELQAQLAAGGGLSPPNPAAARPATFVTEQQVRAWIEEAFAQRIPAVQQRLQGFDAMFAKALPKDDYAAFQQYMAAGSPGFDQLLASDKLYPLVQLLWDTIKEHK